MTRLLLGANSPEAACQARALMAQGGAEIAGFLDNDPSMPCMHGFLTLSDENKEFFRMSEFLHPECAAGIRWGAPSVGIEEWAAYPSIISKQDHQHVLLENIKGC